MIRLKLTFLIVIAVLKGFSQSRINFDSLRNASQNPFENKAKVDALNSWAYELRRINPDSGLVLSEQAFAISKKLNYPIGLADYFTNRGTFLFGIDNDSALYFFRKALENYPQNEWLRISKVQSSISNTYLIQSDYDSAIFYGRLALTTTLVNPIPDSELKIYRLIWNYKGLGDVYSYTGIYDSSITYSLKALKLAEKFAYTDAQSGSLIAIANVYSQQEEYNKAILYTKKAAEIYKQTNNFKSLVLTMTNIGSFYNYIGQFRFAKMYTDSAMTLADEHQITRHYPMNYLVLGDIEKRQGRCKEALLFFNKGIELAQQYENYYVLTMLTGIVGETYNCLGKGKDAVVWFLKSLGMADGDGENTLAAYLGLSQAYEITGDFKNAFTYQKKYIDLKDSLYNVKKAKIINELNVKYEGEKKTDKINWLIRENQLKASVVVSEKQKKQYAIGVIFVLILAGSYVFYSYMKQKKSEHQKAILDERLRISRELHDDMGSTLSSISVYSEVGKKRFLKNADTEEVLQKISFASRELIDKMSDIVWSLNPVNETLEHLKDRMLSFAAIMLNPKEIGFEFDTDDALHSVTLHQDQLKNIFLIYKEIIHNIVKYADCSFVVISIKTDQKKIILKISDDGKGFDTALQKNGMGGSGISNMKARAKSINAILTVSSSQTEGTSVGLEMEV